MRVSLLKKGKSFIIHQSLYARRLKKLSIDCTFNVFRARRHEVTWLTDTRPDLCSSVAFLSRITEKKFDKKAVTLANATIRGAQVGKIKRVLQNDLRRGSLEIITFSDSSFANHDDLCTQLGYAILLIDSTHRVN